MPGPDRTCPRQGWAADSMRLAAAGDDGLVWPEFANDEDCDVKWEETETLPALAPSSRASEAQTRDPS